MDISTIGLNGVQSTGNGWTLTGVADENKGNDMFSTLLSSAMDMIKETDALAEKAEQMEIAFSLGEVDNTHDVTIAQSKALVSLQYTVAVKNALLEAYNQIMNIQI